MNDFKTLVSEASKLRREKRYSEAVANYEQAWVKDAESFNEWDYAGYMHCLRKVGNVIAGLDSQATTIIFGLLILLVLKL